MLKADSTETESTILNSLISEAFSFLRDGACVCFAHFAKVPTQKPSTEWPSVGMSEYVRLTSNAISTAPGELEIETGATSPANVRSQNIRDSPDEHRSVIQDVLVRSTQKGGPTTPELSPCERTPPKPHTPYSTENIAIALSPKTIGARGSCNAGVHGPPLTPRRPDDVASNASSLLIPGPTHTPTRNTDAKYSPGGNSPGEVSDGRSPTLAFRCSGNDTSSQVFDAIFAGRSLSPSNFFAKICAKVASFGHSAFDIPEGVSLRNFTEREYKYIIDGPEDFGLYKEEMSGYYFPLSAFEERQAVRAVMEELRRSGGETIRLSDFRCKNEENWVAIRAYLEKLTDENDICYCEDEGTIKAFVGIPSVFPWEGTVGPGFQGQSTEFDAENPTQIIRMPYSGKPPNQITPISMPPPAYRI